MQLDALRQGNMHAVILAAPMGYGKQTVATAWIADVLHISQAHTHQSVLVIGGGEESLKLEDIKQVKNFLQLKTTGVNAIRRAILILDAHTMNDESQNALLKSLEEPPEDTVIVLTAAYTHSLKQTIVSRSAIVELLPLHEAEITAYFMSHFPDQESEVQKAYKVTNGNVGLMDALLRDTEHPLLTAIDEAKNLLSQSQFERLIAIDKLVKDRQQVLLLLQALITIAQAGFTAAATSNDNTKHKKWLLIIEQVHQAQAAALANANLKLLMTRLFVSI